MWYRRVFVDVDTQVDFMDPVGKLHVPGAEELVPALRRLFQAARARSIPVISSADNHAPDDPEFKHFPPHCVRGTPGQRKIPETLLPNHIIIEPQDLVANPAALFREHRQVIFHKPTIDVYANPNAIRMVEGLQADEFIVFGVATDYCVRADVLGLLQRGKRVRVVGDAVRGIAEGTTRRACEEMQRAGATWTTVADVTETMQQ